MDRRLGIELDTTIAVCSELVLLNLLSRELVCYSARRAVIGSARVARRAGA